MRDSLTISLEDVLLHGYHGVMEQEKKVGNEFSLTVEAEMIPPEGCLTDSLQGTISYAEMYDVVREEFAKRADLIEHVAHRIASALLLRWPQIETVKVKLTKMAPPIPSFAGRSAVTLQLHR